MKYCFYILLFLFSNLGFTQSTEKSKDELIYFTTKFNSDDLLSSLNYSIEIDSIITISDGVSISLKLTKESATWENGLIRCERYYDGIKPYGTWYYFNQEGKIKYSLDNFQNYYFLRIHFNDGTIHSIRKFPIDADDKNVHCAEENYHPNGATESTGSKVTILLANHLTLTENGKWKYYYPNGLLESSGRFVNGKKEGKWLYYSFKGHKTRLVTFKNGVVVSQKLLTD